MGPHRNNVQLGQYGRNRTNVWQYSSPNPFSRGSDGEVGKLLALRPTVKPVAMIADAIMDCTARGDIVLDAFLGSGTTIIAAERTGRRCHGLELDPAYVDLLITRFQNFTRKQAMHALKRLAPERPSPRRSRSRTLDFS
jgi:DNA modification methylase